MTHFKGKEPGILKELIAGDNVESEKKYKETITINPKVILTITYLRISKPNRWN